MIIKNDNNATKIFQERIDNITGIHDKYIVLSEYEKASIPISLKHEVCETIFSVRPEKFTGKTKQRCPKCTKEDKTREYFENFKCLFKEAANNEYILVEEKDYINNESMIRIKHVICDNEFIMKANNFTSNKQKCPICALKIRTTKIVEIGKQNSLTTEIINERLESRGYSLVSNYRGLVNEHEEFIHIKCGRTFSTKPSNILAGTSCPYCSIEKLRLSDEEFKEAIKNKSNGEYIALEDYKGNNKVKHKFKHLKCGNEFEASPVKVMYDTGCPICKSSKMVLKIKDILQKNNINFMLEFVDSRCKNKKVLPFDFAIKLKDSRTLLIEYDGIQHFEPSFGYSDSQKLENLKIQKFRDGIKDAFCATFSSEYVLHRIHYKDSSSIENIINGLIQKYRLK